MSKSGPEAQFRKWCQTMPSQLSVKEVEKVLNHFGFVKTRSNSHGNFYDNSTIPFDRTFNPFHIDTHYKQQNDVVGKRGIRMVLNAIKYSLEINDNI